MKILARNGERKSLSPASSPGKRVREPYSRGKLVDRRIRFSTSSSGIKHSVAARLRLASAGGFDAISLFSSIVEFSVVGKCAIIGN